MADKILEFSYLIESYDSSYKTMTFRQRCREVLAIVNYFIDHHADFRSATHRNLEQMICFKLGEFERSGADVSAERKRLARALPRHDHPLSYYCSNPFSSEQSAANLRFR